MDRSSSLDRDHQNSAPIAVLPSPQDAYRPAQAARLVEQVGVKKATLPGVQTLARGALAGAAADYSSPWFYWLLYLPPAAHRAAR